MNGLLDKHAPFKKVSKYQLKLKTKPWITAAIHKAVLVKKSLFKKYIKLKDPVKKIQTHDKYKHYRNLLSTVIKKGKKNHNAFCKNNMNNIKNICFTKHSSFIFINETVTDPKKIANIFNDYFSTIAEKTKAKTKFSNKLFYEFFQHASENSLFLKSISSDEIISSLNESKSVGPNSLPTKILKLLKNDILLQVTNIFNLFFSTGVFPSELEFAKVIPIDKKGSKLKF